MKAFISIFSSLNYYGTTESGITIRGTDSKKIVHELAVLGVTEIKVHNHYWDADRYEMPEFPAIGEPAHLIRKPLIKRIFDSLRNTLHTSTQH